MDLGAILQSYVDDYKKIMSDEAYRESCAMPSGNYFLKDGSVLSLPRDDGDSRYPYGEKGFNFWTYGSGYMHCNEGLFSPFLRAVEGQEPKIAFFASFKKDNGHYDVVPVLSVPNILTDLKVERYTIFTMSATYYVCEVKGIRVAVRVFVDDQKDVHFSMMAESIDGSEQTCQLSYYVNPFVKNALVENSVDRWFRQVNYADDKGLGHFVVEAYEEVDRNKMAANIGVYRLTCDEETNKKIQNHQITTSRYAVVGGSRGSLHTPKGLMNGSFGEEQKTCAFTETAIMSGIIDVMVQDPIRIDGCFSYCFDDKTKEKLISRPMSQVAVDQQALKVDRHEAEKQAALKMSFGQSSDQVLKPMAMNQFMKHIMKQVEFCSVIKGYIQLSSFSLIGIRDVFQALEGVLFYEQDVAREKMLEALNFVTKEGRCPRQYILPSEDGQVHSMDLRPFIDQGVWVISTIVNYVRFTKDYEFLNESCGYYKFVDEHKHLAQKDEGSSSVLNHMIEILDYLLTNRDVGHTECVLALYGDWNDALDGLGNTDKEGQAYGTGVSVMATLQVYQNLTEMIELLSLLNTNEKSYDDLIEDYTRIQKLIAGGVRSHALVEEEGLKKILHGWGDDKSYVVGGFEDPDGLSRDGLTSNAFWVLSDLIQETPELKEDILAAFDRLDGKYGLKTFTPHFEKGTEGVGRIPNLPEGTAENGATYIHASLFGVMALFKMGESERAWQELRKLLPITHDHISCSPYVMPNSYGYNEELNIDGESMADWQTGSSNVLLKLILKYVIGFEAHYKGVYIQPAAYNPFGETSCVIEYMNTSLTIKYNVSDEPRYFKVNGNKVDSEWDDLMGIEKLFVADDYFDGQAMTIEVCGK